MKAYLYGVESKKTKSQKNWNFESGFDSRQEARDWVRDEMAWDLDWVRDEMAWDLALAEIFRIVRFYRGEVIR